MPIKVVMPEQSRLDAFTQIFASNSDTMFMRLFQNVVYVQDTTVLGDLSEANYDGYNKVDLSATPSLEDGPAGVEGQTARTGPDIVEFPECTGGGGNQIYGVYCTYVGEDAAEHLFLACNCFDEFGETLVGVLVDPTNPPPPIVWLSYLWDYFQPSPPPPP